MNEERDAKGRFASEPTEARFFRKVNKQGATMPHMTSPCWEWIGHRFGNGYGNIRHDKRRSLTHRVAWQLVNGPIPEGLVAIHKCDNPRCVRVESDPNLSHIWIGTQAENLADMRRKNRQASADKTSHHGEDNGSAKLTSEQVREIRRKFKPRVCGYRPLAEEFGVSPHTIEAIVRGLIWRTKSAGYGLLGAAAAETGHDEDE